MCYDTVKLTSCLGSLSETSDTTMKSHIYEVDLYHLKRGATFFLEVAQNQVAFDAVYLVVG